MTGMSVELKENEERYPSEMRCDNFVNNGNEKTLTFEETEKIKCLDGLTKQRQELWEKIANIIGDDKERIDSLNKVVNGGYDRLLKSGKIEEDPEYYNHGNSNKTAPRAKLSPSKAQLAIDQENRKVDRSKQNKGRKEKITQHKVEPIKETEAMEVVETMREEKADSSLWKNKKAPSFKPSWIPTTEKINDNLKKISDAGEKNVSIVEFVRLVIDEFVKFYSIPHYGLLSWSDGNDCKKVEYTPKEKIIEKDAIWQGLQEFGAEFFPFLTHKYLENLRKQYNNSKKLNGLGAKIEEDYRVATKRAAEKAVVVVEAKEAKVNGEAVEKMSASKSIKKEMGDRSGDRSGDKITQG